MAASVVTVDARGRISVPADLRKQLELEPGDALFVEIEDNGQVLRLAKAVNPFDSLTAMAEYEYRAGRTRNLRAFAEDEGISLDDE